MPKRDPGKLYCEKCSKEINEGEAMVETNEGFYHFKCRHPVLYKKMKAWRKK
jgi:hypothetical protein